MAQAIRMIREELVEMLREKEPDVRALAMMLIDAAAKILCEMATFESAGVTGEMVETHAV